MPSPPRSARPSSASSTTAVLDLDGDRRREMRAIRDLLAAGRVDDVTEPVPIDDAIVGRVDRGWVDQTPARRSDPVAFGVRAAAARVSIEGRPGTCRRRRNPPRRAIGSEVIQYSTTSRVSRLRLSHHPLLRHVWGTRVRDGVDRLRRASCGTSPANAAARQFVGSAACESCHRDIYSRWKTTLMANVVRDPKQHPDAILGDFSRPNPLVSFKKEDVAFTYGSKWKQRYFTQIGDDYFVFPAQWDVQNKTWRPYSPRPGTDWWTSVYPDDQMQRPTGPLCDGCHSVNYDVKTRTVTEWNVGCERCHGAGSQHVRDERVAVHRQSRQARPRSSRRRVYSVPLAGEAADQSHRGSLLRLGRRLSARRSPGRRVAARRTSPRRRRRSRTGPKGRRTRIACRATTTCRARCT